MSRYMSAKDPKLSERLLYLVSPKRGNDAYNKRLREQNLKEKSNKSDRIRFFSMITLEIFDTCAEQNFAHE